MIKRIFPTQLKVVDTIDLLVPEEEGRRGYYSQNGKLVVDIAVKGPNQIFITCPSWYKSYTFTIDVDVLQAQQQKQLQQMPQSSSSSYAAVEEEETRPLSRTNALWKLIATVVKSECGRRALYKDGERFIRVTHLLKNHAKQLYYLMKHVLMRMAVPFKLDSTWYTPSFAETEIPDIRERQKRRRKRKTTDIELLASTTNRWRTVL